jgi:hypothetical protein
MRFISDDKGHAPQTKSKMQVLALGLPRCATSSLQAALESDVINMGPSMHMAHVAPHADRLRAVIDALNLPKGSPERQKVLRRLFDGWGATSDFPGCVFAADLMDMYPDAAIVLNQRRNGRAWLESMTGSLKFFSTLPFLLICFLWTTDRLHWRIHQIAGKVVAESSGVKEFYSAEFYDAHNRWVLDEAAKRGRKVLRWQAQDGWGPLCEFLGKDLPEDGRPFPHLNDAATMNTLKRVLVARGLISWGVLGGLVGWGAWYLSRR